MRYFAAVFEDPNTATDMEVLAIKNGSTLMLWWRRLSNRSSYYLQQVLISGLDKEVLKVVFETGI